MAIYRTWSTVSGTATNPTKAYDYSYGDLTSCALLSTTSGLTKSHIYQSTQSLTGMSTCSLKLRWKYWVGVAADADVNGIVDLSYSWDGSTWYALLTDFGDPSERTATTEAVYTLSNFNASTNLNSLRVRFSASPGREFDPELGKTIWFPSSVEIYDMAVDAASGPVYTVNTISGPSSLYAGYQGSYSATVTNDATNNCTWSIVSGGGTLSGAVNDATSSRVTLAAPLTSGGSVVLRCRSNLDTSKYQDITVSVPLVGISLTVGPSRMRAGYPGWYQVTVTGHADTRANWSVTGGSLNVTQANSVTWTVPTTRGKYIISGSHVYDASKTFSYAVYVDYFYPNNYTVGVADAAQVGCDLVSGGQAIDEQLNSYAYANSYWVSEGQGASYGYYDLYDFPDTPNLVSTNLVLYYSSRSTDIYYSIDGGQNWVFATSAPGSGNASPLIITVAPGSIYNLNQLRVRFCLNSWCEREWNRDTQQWDNVSAGGWVYLYEIRAEPTQRAYSAVTGTSDRGTTPTPLFMPGQFQPLTGTMSGAGTSPVALTGPGTSTTPVAIPFFLGASSG